MPQPPLKIVGDQEPATVEPAAPRSFDEFFAVESETLYRRMWLVTRDRHEAEEVVQDAFLRLFERWDRVSTVPDPTGYLYRTAFNAWKRRVRRAVLLRSRLTAEPDAFDHYEAVDARIVLDQALDQLTPRQRAAIVLTELLGYSSEEAGATLGVRPVTARVLASQARAGMRTWLEAESQRVDLPADTARRVLERGRRRARNRRAAAFGIGALLFVVVVAVIRAAAPSREPQPAVPTPAPTSPGSVAGSYSVRLPDTDDEVQRFGLEGRYSMELTRSGDLLLGGPREFDLSGDPITFDVERGRFTTDLMVGERCDTSGRYRVTLTEGILTLTPQDESCDPRRVLLASAPWTAARSAPPADPLEGDWIATFTCDQMLRAVHRAPVGGQMEAYWRRSVAVQRRSDDFDDPCGRSDTPVGYKFRFDHGRLLIFDRDLQGDLPEGFDGRYEIDGDAITISDGEYDNILGRYRVAFRIEGDQVMFDLLGRGGRDPFFVGAWESAPFVRDS
jgi:RNA polymerase sigma factor (sigma-70 family)